MEALALMNTGKAAGPSGVTVELLNACKNRVCEKIGGS